MGSSARRQGRSASALSSRIEELRLTITRVIALTSTVIVGVAVGGDGGQKELEEDDHGALHLRKDGALFKGIVSARSETREGDKNTRRASLPSPTSAHRPS